MRMSMVLTVRMAPQKLAQLDRRAPEPGRDRCGYVRSLIEEDLKSARKVRKRVFALRGPGRLRCERDQIGRQRHRPAGDSRARAGPPTLPPQPAMTLTSIF